MPWTERRKGSKAGHFGFPAIPLSEKLALKGDGEEGACRWEKAGRERGRSCSVTWNSNKFGEASIMKAEEGQEQRRKPNVRCFQRVLFQVLQEVGNESRRFLRGKACEGSWERLREPSDCNAGQTWGRGERGGWKARWWEHPVGQGCQGALRRSLWSAESHDSQSWASFSILPLSATDWEVEDLKGPLCWLSHWIPVFKANSRLEPLFSKLMIKLYASPTREFQ